MFSKSLYNKINPGSSYCKYWFREVWKKVRMFTYGWIYPTYLCIRFPFLYPRNRFTDRHYTNWSLQKKMSAIEKKWSEWSKEHVQECVDKFGENVIFLDGKYVTCDYMKLATPKDRFLHKFYNALEGFLGWFHVIPTFTELDAMPTGWKKRFGIQFCKELKEAIKKSPDKDYMKKFRITQIKEKYGDLRVYVNFYSPEVSRVINKYEYISRFVCINCGEDATKETMGWISPYCDKCVPEHERWLWIDPIYGWSDGKKQEENKKIKEELP